MCVHHVFVSGAALDERVDPSRAMIRLDEDDSILDNDGLSEKSLRSALDIHVNEYLKARLQTVRDDNLQQIRRHIQTSQPEYRVLLNHRPESLERLEYTDDRERLDEALYRELQAFELEVRRKQADVEKKLGDESADVDGVAVELSQVIEQVNEAGKSNLVRYVANRRAVLSFMKKLVARKALEAHIHRIVFPMRSTSNEVAYDEHNLWLLDDTLAFFEFVASDVRLSEIHGAGVESDRRPDILAFKTGDPPFHRIALVEFKRPERKDENPVQQLVEYARLLRSGRARAADGASLPSIPMSVRIDGFAVVSLTPEIDSRIEDGPANMIRAVDEWRWNGMHPNANLTIEVVDFHAFVTRAEQRNRAFFAKLGLP